MTAREGMAGSGTAEGRAQRGLPKGRYRAGERGGRRSDPRLPAYLAGGFGALLAAIVLGAPSLAALGAPLLVLAALGILRGRPPEVRGSVRVEGDRVIEGDVLAGTVGVAWEGEAEVDVMLAGWRGVSPLEPAPAVGWSLASGSGPVGLAFELRARWWGVHELGRLWVRVRRPGGFLVEERELAVAPSVKVLPSPLRLDRLLEPDEPRAVAGMHVSRLRGHGTDFAELRPYQPGDRMRDISWATSARLGEPWVTVHHPERTGTVLLLLDAFLRDDPTSTEVLARAARAAWAVASVHLRAQDRVGLLARGGTPAWVPPQGGLRARWLLLDELLGVGGAAGDRWRRRARGGRILVPTDALVVGVTSLHSRTFMQDLLHYRRTGHATAALVIDTADLLPDPADRVDAAARRIWLAQRDAERHTLERGGVPTALVTGAGGVGGAVSSLRRRMAGLRSNRAGALAR